MLTNEVRFKFTRYLADNSTCFAYEQIQVTKLWIQAIDDVKNLLVDNNPTIFSKNVKLNRKRRLQVSLNYSSTLH